MNKKTKRKYKVILYLSYRDTIDIETEEEDEEKIKEDVRLTFIEEIKGMCGAGDILDNLRAVRIDLATPEQLKPFEVHYSPYAGGLSVFVNATDECEAAEMADDILSVNFISDDGLTECEIDKYEYYDVQDIEALKKVNEEAMERERIRMQGEMKNGT